MAISVKSDLPPATEGKPYRAALIADSLVLPCAWKVVDGNLPAGLEITQDGVVQGIPAAAGTEEFRVQARDTGDHIEEALLTITVTASRKYKRQSSIREYLVGAPFAVPPFTAIWLFIYSIATPGKHFLYFAVGMIAGSASFLAACLVGFLFGIPRVVTSDTRTAAKGQRLPSSNLAAVSDWLTKLLLGAVLVSLARLGSLAAKTNDHLASALGMSNSPTFSASITAASVLIVFGATGMLISYFATTSWYIDKLKKFGNGDFREEAQDYTVSPNHQDE